MNINCSPTIKAGYFNLTLQQSFANNNKQRNQREPENTGPRERKVNNLGEQDSATAALKPCQ